jgi:hypothetical protein
VKLSRPTLKTPKIKAPKVKRPEVKLPPAVTAVIDNLRERGLLPVAVLLVVAIVAVPFLLSGGSEAPPPKPQPSAAVAADAAQTQQAVVLADQQGVRDYKKRLDGSPTDPFKQQYAAPASGGGTAATGVTQTGGGTSAGGSSGDTSGGASSSGGGVPSSTPVPGSSVSYYAADMYVGLAGKKLKLWKNVKHGASLPNENVRAAVFLGVPLDKAGVAQFVISSAVVDIAGDGHCSLGSGTCELIRLKVGDTMKLTYGNGKTYAVKLARTYPTTTTLSSGGK